jgi:hypothetical protein
MMIWSGKCSKNEKGLMLLHCRLIVKLFYREPSIDKEGKHFILHPICLVLWVIYLWKILYGIPKKFRNSINTAGMKFLQRMTIFLCFFFKWDNTGFTFSVDLNAGGTPKNIGQPINSRKTILHSTKKNIGYISSNRSGIDHI